VFAEVKHAQVANDASACSSDTRVPGTFFVAFDVRTQSHAVREKYALSPLKKYRNAVPELTVDGKTLVVLTGMSGTRVPGRQAQLTVKLHTCKHFTIYIMTHHVLITTDI